ncbi:hypothetical protein ACL9RF_17085 [Sphingobacterium sp. Mn56C]|uniref:hypothetical protein n=1 Tax=Sphingobacterium sp. Mn56C TaxID=3395261 RepID=UPI003BC3C62E
MDRKKQKEPDKAARAKEITDKDIINLIGLKNIKLKDPTYAENNLKIEKIQKLTKFQVTITDIDGEQISFQFELKTYK